MNNIPPIFIFNMRIWRLHFQVELHWKIKIIFAWYDLWIGLFVDTSKRRFYFFPIPMLGIQTEGLWITYNKAYNRKTHPFIWVFNFNGKYYPLKRKS